MKGFFYFCSMLLFIGGSETVVILLFIIIFFGSKKIPELARGLGKSIQEFRKAKNEIKEEIDKGADEVDSK